MAPPLKILETCLVSWMKDKVMSISVDNVAANKHAVEYVRKKMMNWTVPPILGGHHIHVRCLAHILNLIVRSGLSILDKSVVSIRNAVRYVRSSSSRLDTFKMCVEKEILDVRKVCILDVPTRWNSTFLMLETAMELRKAFDRLAEEEEGKRMLGMEDGEVKVKERKLKELIVAMTDIYAALTSTPKQKVATTEMQSVRSVHRGVSGKMAEMMENWDKELAESDEVVVESEVNRYLIDPFEKSKDGEPLEFWTSGSTMGQNILTCKLWQEMC
ncbi:zinc finger BED domain-containing protein DAYSLEEPER-like [Rosa chinensis]|uniref:zinc finger BED domain-containing protein DAYSLEEPER-like n=1 Tax=Rosa chinensis TaxID=74649 RepID=UPI000D0868C5|nr:zinc finger BED domain-containing protein DAYSLEEPER-like [Rosa chinensis]